MKLLLPVLIVALAAVGSSYFYFRDHPIVWSQGPELATPPGPGGRSASAPDAAKGFKEISKQLRDEMNRIPASLRDARQMPVHALEIRTRLTRYLQLHTEYQTLTEACDLIIEADQTFAEHQGKFGIAPAGAGTTAPDRVWASSAPVTTVYQQQQMLWDNQRRMADGKVRELLAGLENRRL